MSSSAHLADGDLRAQLDDELPAARRAAVEDHLATCVDCRARIGVLEVAKRETAALLDLLPGTVPDAPVRTIVARAGAPHRRWGVIAAALALCVATVAGATVGRPYVRAVVAKIVAVVSHKATASQPPSPEHGQNAGIAFVPGPESEIRFDARQRAGTLQLLLVDTDKLVVNSTVPVPFRISASSVIVHNGGSLASYQVELPRSAPHVRVLVAGRLLLEKRGAAITGAAATAGVDSTGQYLIPLR